MHQRRRDEPRRYDHRRDAEEWEDEDLDEFPRQRMTQTEKLLARQFLKVSQMTAMLADASNFHHFSVPKDSEMFQTMLRAQQGWNAAAKGKHRQFQAEVGPRKFTVWMMTVEYCKTQMERKPPGQQDVIPTLTQYLDIIQKAKPTEMALDIGEITLGGGFNNYHTKKVTFEIARVSSIAGANHYLIFRIVRAILLEQDGAKEHQGKAPQGKMERDIQNNLRGR